MTRQLMLPIALLTALAAAARGGEAETAPVKLRELTVETEFRGASAGPDGMFCVLSQHELIAYSAVGEELWRAPAPWYEMPESDKGCGRCGNRPPSYNRPGPVPLSGGKVATLNCVRWKLAIQVYGRDGAVLAEARPVGLRIRKMMGILHLCRSQDRLMFGYRMGTMSARRDRHRGVIAYDSELRKLWDARLWGDTMVCTDDGSVYAPRDDEKRDQEWTRINPHGRKSLLPKEISQDTGVILAGLGGELMLWRHPRDGEGKPLRGLRGYLLEYAAWRPGEESPSTIIDNTTCALIGATPGPGGRYIVKTALDGRKSFVCLDRAGKELWRYSLQSAYHFEQPRPLFDRGGDVLVMDTRRTDEKGGATVFVICLSANGKKKWELPVKRVAKQPFYYSRSSEDGRMLIVRDEMKPVRFTLTFIGPAK